MKRFLTLALLIITPALSGTAFAQQDPEVELVPAQTINEGETMNSLNIFARPADLSITTFTSTITGGNLGSFIGISSEGQFISSEYPQDTVDASMTQRSSTIEYSVVTGGSKFVGQFLLTVIKVELPLTAGTPLADISALAFGTPRDVDLLPTFVNTDNDDLTYEIRQPAGGADAVVSVVISDNTATLTAVAMGSTTVEICATDVPSNPQSTDFLCDSFAVAVPPRLVFPGPEPVVADQLYLTTETVSLTLPEATGGSGSGYAYTLAGQRRQPAGWAGV